jgi:hypothetical protein
LAVVAEMNVTLTNGEQVTLEMRVLEAGLRDLRPFWRVLFPMTQRWIRSQFRTQGAFGNTLWPPLSENYAKAKKAKWGRRPILVASGDLRKEVFHPKQRATPTSLLVYIEENITDHHGPIARFHQEGTERMPRRPILFDELPQKADLELRAAADRYVDKLLTRARR